ncbi:phospholipase A2 [Thauera butanivorans]|uniref:phospholipase A2 n=1 Tax=Thauera butanivorans TaxID=86174 RepID=UPI000838856E|nr:phospholipase A2 [Thauera butanivorans]
MSGKPAARITDGVSDGVIVTGAPTVLIGSQGGVACSECPGGVAVGSPVNPSLGVKVLSGAADLDFALPGAMPLVWQRQYSSYVNAEHGGYCGVLGYGWSMPLELRLTVRDDTVLLHDTQGRIITFEALAPGEHLYSPSEDLWLLRGAGPGAATAQPAALPDWHEGRFGYIAPALAGNAYLIFASNGTGDIVWVFGPSNWQAMDAARKDAKPVPEPRADWVLFGKLDRLGRAQRYRWEEILGQPRITGIEDGVGRHYHLHYARTHAARDARHCPSGYRWQADSGVRLAGVDLVFDPIHPRSGQDGAQPIALVRYRYSGEGDLIAVHDRHGEPVRRFGWRNHLMVLHQERTGPEHRYRYDRDEPGGRVIEQRNEQGLDYRFTYTELPGVQEQPRKACEVADSLGRSETYVFQGEAGLARLVEHRRADGSTLRRSYNAYGQLTLVADPLGRTTQLQISPAGQLLGSQGPDGSTSRQRYDEATGLLQSRIDAAGRTTSYYYDAHHRLIRITGADGSSENYAYPDPSQDPYNADKPILIIDAKGGRKKLEYTREGLLACYTDCSGYSTRYTYTRWGQIAVVTNALGKRIRYVYDSRDRLQAVHYPDGGFECYRYDGQGQISQVQAGHEEASIPPSTTASLVSLEYDLWGRLVRRSHAGHTLGFAYDRAGRLTQLVNENAEHSHFEWDVMDRLIRETGFDARVQSYRYDAAGQLTESSDGWTDEQGLPNHTSTYEWNEAGQLVARHLPATEHAPASTHRYRWNKAGDLEQASVWQHEAKGPKLHSQVDIERDGAGRLIGEVQRLFKIDSAEAQIEFEHRIVHTLDALGNRTASQLQGLGEVGYLLYGSGHLHGVTWQGESLVDFERDALHREIRRQLGMARDPAASQPLMRRLSWDSAGRLQAMQLTGLSGDRADVFASAVDPVRPPPALVGALTARHYHYDSLGQMIGIQSPAGPSRFGYDAAGRLTAAQSPQAGEQRWRFDPAGNRLPIGERPMQEADELKPDWMAPHYNVLQGKAGAQNGAEITYWPGNRVGHHHSDRDVGSEGASLRYRYDSRGNRRESEDEVSGQRMVLDYDASKQLIEVHRETGEERRAQRYRYDAFGRRLAKYDSTGAVAYFGWDGDRLIHTERHCPERRVPEIIHTVYEPGGFTPLIQLRATEKSGAEPLQALLESIPDTIVQDTLRPMLTDLAGTLALLQDKGRQIGMPADALALMGEQLHDLQQQTLAHRVGNGKHIEVRHYLCDHLGTPQALIGETGQIDWAASLDAWGNVLAEHNPKGLYQPIRLPGQHHDPETGLYYNRHRYYDATLGAYVNQDPIGFSGGVNWFRYPVNPVEGIDPLGLQYVDGRLIMADRVAGIPRSDQPGLFERLRDAPRKDGQPLGHGCGDSKTDNFVPDRPLSFDFFPACRKHDICYGEKNGPSKKQCDDNFKRDMNEACSKENWLMRKYCEAVARDYYFAVDWFGGEAFENARK